MNSIDSNELDNSKKYQVIDANLDRAREGLRVIEDWCRYYMTNKDLIVILKNWRHKLGELHLNKFKLARCTFSDQGLGLKHPSQNNRNTSEELISSNCSRVQEALRVLEEFSRISEPSIAETATEIRYGLYELEIKIVKHSLHQSRIQILNSCNLCLITNTQERLIETVTKSLQAGVKMVQYRCKDKTDYEKYKEAKEICSICKKYNSLFIVNDRLDLAIAVDSDGIHLGQEDMPVSIARKIIGDEMLIGKSTHSKKEIQSLQKENIDYLGVGPITYTEKKSKLQPLGINYLNNISKINMLPWFAIGGINLSNLKEIKAAGVQKIAVIGAIMDSKDPYKETQLLIEGLK